MKDVSLGLVQVQSDRLNNTQKKALKKKISNLDRLIQVVQIGIYQAQCNIDSMAFFYPDKTSKEIPSCWTRWIDIKTKLENKRAKLDRQRKDARLKLKGYSK